MRQPGSSSQPQQPPAPDRSSICWLHDAGSRLSSAYCERHSLWLIIVPAIGVTARWCVYTHEPIIGYRHENCGLKGIRKPGRACFCVSHKVSVTQTLYKLASTTQPARHTTVHVYIQLYRSIAAAGCWAQEKVTIVTFWRQGTRGALMRWATTA